MQNAKILMIAATAAMTTAIPTASAQDIEGDATSPVTQWGRMLAEPGTFWLDSNDDVEIIRYTTPRDVSLCLSKPSGVGAADKGYPLRITWDNQFSVVLKPGNCFFFDAKMVKVKPAADLPSGVVLTGKIQTESALQRGN